MPRLPRTLINQQHKRAGSSDLDQALINCRSALRVCAGFSIAINVLMLASPIYMLQVYDRVLTTGHVETLVMLTVMVAVALAIMCALDALRTAVTIRIGGWLNERLGPVYLACGIRARLLGEVGGAQPLRDVAQLQNFIATQGLTAFFDPPWVPLFLALIWILHPLLGAIAVGAALALLGLSFANEVITRKSTEAASDAQLRALRMADTSIRNAEVVSAMGMLDALVDRWIALNETVNDGLRWAETPGVWCWRPPSSPGFLFR